MLAANIALLLLPLWAGGRALRAAATSDERLLLGALLAGNGIFLAMIVTVPPPHFPDVQWFWPGHLPFPPPSGCHWRPTRARRPRTGRGPGRPTGEASVAEVCGTHPGAGVDVNGMSMYYEECGEGPPVVLMHGGMGSSLRMRPAAEILSSRYRVITPDSRAHGRSNNPSGELSYAVMADDIAALIEMLDLDRPFVGGWSDGGQVALEIGMRYPDVSRGLIVAGAYYALPGQLGETIWDMGFEGQGVLNTEVFERSLDVYGGGDYPKALDPQGAGYHQTRAM